MKMRFHLILNNNFTGFNSFQKSKITDLSGGYFEQHIY